MDDALRRLVDVLSAADGSGDGMPRLPTERELGARLGISRGALREQLASLEILGLLRRTQGSGTYLEVPDPTFVRLYFELALRFGHIGRAEVERARELLELSIVREAALRASDADVVALDGLVRAMTAASAAGRVEAGNAADYDFHRLLVRIVANPVLDMISDGLAYVLRHLLAERRRVALAQERAAGATEWATDAVHLDIVAAVRDHDPDAAQRAMVEHFDLWRNLAAAPTDTAPTDRPVERTVRT